jgi:hypothetical protein
MLPSLKDVMDIVISTVNYIRRNGLTHRQFQHFLEEIETEYGGDICYSAEMVEQRYSPEEIILFMI